jgi:Zn-dependent protease
MEQRTLILVIVVVAIVAVLVGAKKIQSTEIIYWAVLIPSIILHEISHGWVANFFGDDTAKRAGRLSLNPLRHIDPFGSVILPALLVLSRSGVAFGWAKPVPVNISRLRHPRNNSIWVSLAGPFTNAVLFVVCGLVFRFLFDHGVFLSAVNTGLPLGYEILFEAAMANLTLCFFNLLPIPPLDGSVLIERLLPPSALQGYFRIRPYGMLIVFAVAFIGLQNPTFGNHVFDGELRLFNGVSGAGF